MKKWKLAILSCLIMLLLAATFTLGENSRPQAAHAASAHAASAHTVQLRFNCWQPMWYVQISGTNQYGSTAQWTWNGTNWGNQTYSVTTTNWWWQGRVNITYWFPYSWTSPYSNYTFTPNSGSLYTVGCSPYSINPRI